jgi:hypothetical protein
MGVNNLHLNNLYFCSEIFFSIREGSFIRYGRRYLVVLQIASIYVERIKNNDWTGWMIELAKDYMKGLDQRLRNN